jgi:hypothetical protein
MSHVKTIHETSKTYKFLITLSFAVYCRKPVFQHILEFIYGATNKGFNGKRWPIELFFRHTKGTLGLNQYQVRSTVDIDRFSLLVTLTYLYCVRGTGQYRKFSSGLAAVRKTTEHEQVSWFEKKAPTNVPLEEIIQQLKIA